MKKLQSIALALTMVLSLSACASTQLVAQESLVESTPVVEESVEVEVPVEEETFTPATYHIAALSGPTAMGLVPLMHAADNDTDLDGTALSNTYDFTLAGAATEILPLLIKGEIDMACLPANTGAVLYPQLEEDLQVLAINTLGVLYIVSQGEDISSIADLAGKTIAAAGQGSTPEYSLAYLLEENGIADAVTIDWKTEHAECVTALATGSATIALLPQPFVTVAQSNLPELEVSIDLNQAWDDLGTDSGLITGVIVAKRSLVEENPESINAFLAEYATSVNLVNSDNETAATWIGEYGIVTEAVALAALPYCNIVCITGEDMATQLTGYYDVLYAANPDSVGGSVPGDGFYYIP